MTKAPASVLAGAFLVLSLVLSVAGCGSASPSESGETSRTSSSAPSPGGAGSGAAGSATAGDAGVPAEESVADRITAETNRVRVAEGLPVLEPSGCLDAEARRRAVAQARERAAATTPPPLEHAPLEPVTQACGADLRAAENLVDFPAGTDAARVLGAWMQSPGHRNNLVDPGLEQVGTGCAVSAKGTLCSQLYLGPQ